MALAAAESSSCGSIDDDGDVLRCDGRKAQASWLSGISRSSHCFFARFEPCDGGAQALSLAFIIITLLSRAAGQGLACALCPLVPWTNR